MNIILAGMPGSGKTTVAAVFAAMGKTVIDTDEMIVKRYGNISDIFAKYGEAYFRDRETEAVREAVKCDGAVISTGGGCLLREENVRLFKSSGKIVYLRTDVNTLVSRVEGDNSRPLLANGAKEGIERLFKARAHIYLAAADVIVDTDSLTPEQVAQKIMGSV